MIALRKSKERGHVNHGWLDSYHTFSFADYFDPKYMNFRTLRVINEDKIAGGKGFGTHPHKDMEILTYVIKGQLRHKDSIGNEGIIKAGEVQKMTAGSGVTHSEFNVSATEEAYLLQIWILPNQKGLTPSYQQEVLSGKKGIIQMPITFHQDVKVYRGLLDAGQEVSHGIGESRGLWIQMIQGEMKINSVLITAGDGAAVEGQEKAIFTPATAVEFLVFDLK